MEGRVLGNRQTQYMDHRNVHSVANSAIMEIALCLLSILGQYVGQIANLPYIPPIY